jgi:hypothetical protein
VPFRQPGPERLGLAVQGAQVGSAPEDLIDLAYQRRGPGRVGQGEVDTGEFDPRLYGHVRDRVGQQWPRALGADQQLAGSRDVSAVDGRAGLNREDQGSGIAFLGSVRA